MARFLEDDDKATPSSGITSAISPGMSTLHDLLFAPSPQQQQQQHQQPPPGMGLISNHLSQAMGSQSASGVSNDLMEQAAHYHTALQKFRETDRTRDDMVTHIVRQYTDLVQKYQQKCNDYDQERMSLGMWQRENSQLRQQVNELKLANESNPLVFVIIDGDGAVFREDLLYQGEDGGVAAASQLLTDIRKHVKMTYPDVVTDDWTVMVQVFINLEGHARFLHASGLVSDGMRDFTGFARAFGQANSLFSFIDVGNGKERADHKCREMLRVVSRLTQCKHIIFGPCQDKGYLPVLQPYARDPTVSGKLTLLETTQALPGFVSLGLRRVSFPNVFRQEPPPSRYQLPIRNGSLPTAMPPPAPSPFQMRSPIEDAAQAAHTMAALLPPPKPPSVPPQPQAQAQPPPPSQTPMQQPQQQAPPQQQVISVNYSTAGKPINIAPKKPAPPQLYFYVNSISERIDEELPRPLAVAEKRYNAKREKNGNVNFCNNFHLRGYCEQEEYCQYIHGDPLPQSELLIQQRRARGTYCGEGTDCDVFDCYYSHHCQYGRKCGMGHKCKFNDTHHMDLRKAFKIYEDGSREAVPEGKE